ncbi:MAG: sulfotransferase domain-containing protein [Planctomycetota bacterium]|jgi:hypothetical protein
MIIGFATGSGRCGTQTFGAQMQRLRGVLGAHEGRQQIDLMNRRIKKAPNLSCGDPTAREWNVKALEWRKSRFCRPINIAYCEGSHYFALNLDLVAEVFPQVRIVHLLRDPAEMIWSMMQHGGPKIYKNGTHERTPGRWKRWQDCYPLYEGIANQAEGYAKYWQHVNETLAATALPRLLVHTAEMREPETWRRILDFLGLDNFEVKAPRLVFNPRHPRLRADPAPSIVAEAANRFCTWRPQ